MRMQTEFMTTQFRAAGQAAERARLNQLQGSVGRNEIDGDEKARLLDACRGFEEVFLKELLSQMHKLSFGFGDRLSQAGSQIYWEMTDAALAKRLAQADTLGVGRFVYDGLMRELDRFNARAADDQEQTGGLETVG